MSPNEGSSPPTRGARRVCGVGGCGLRLIPAYAGSTTSCFVISSRRPAHPRLRGEHENQRATKSIPLGSSPPTRGALGECDGVPGQGGLIPAYAGSTAIRSLGGASGWAHPRLRGEHGEVSGAANVDRGSSPPTRGAHARRHCRCCSPGLIPAYAGSTKTRCIHRRHEPAHPRLRGEHSYGTQPRAPAEGSSPPTRGAPAPQSRRPRRSGLIPAYAGSTQSWARRPAGLPAHPRLRGEHLSGNGLADGIAGSSPPTRGARGASPKSAVRSRLIPAYAGSTCLVLLRVRCNRAHPRLRGEHSRWGTFHAGLDGSSPPTRGAQSGQAATDRLNGLIPAYAGSTSPRSPARSRAWAHPRLRGEHH